MRLQDKVAVVTGAGQGVGAACARAFAAQGATVVLLGRTLQKVEDVARDICQEGGKAQARRLDVSRADDVDTVFRDILSAHSGVDILVNNAAILRSVPLAQTSAEEWDATLATNLSGAFYCIKGVLPGMMQRRSGKIINVSSMSAKLYFKGFGAYATSKGGMVSMTRILGEEMKEYDVNVNAVNLGMTDTEKTRSRLQTSDPAVSHRLAEMMTAQDVADVLVFLASEESRAFYGASLDLTGKVI